MLLNPITDSELVVREMQALRSFEALFADSVAIGLPVEIQGRLRRYPRIQITEKRTMRGRSVVKKIPLSLIDTAVRRQSSRAS